MDHIQSIKKIEFKKKYINIIVEIDSDFFDDVVDSWGQKEYSGLCNSIGGDIKLALSEVITKSKIH
jgi:hypothetical protein